MLLDSIRTRLDLLSKSERKVALAVLERPEITVAQNITALARSAGVSEPTVVRFCRAIGYGGWQEFKLKLVQALALAPPGAAESTRQEDLAADVIGKVCSRSINALLDLRSNLDADAVQRAMECLASASRIEIYGQGASGLVASDAQHKFSRAGVAAQACSDPNLHAISAAMLRPGDAVLAISRHGKSTQLLRSVALAGSAGADVIVLAPSGTPLAALADVLIAVDLEADTDPYTPMSARLAHLMAIDILAVGLALKRGPEFRKKMLAAQNAVQRLDLQFEAFISEAARSCE
ncbi:MAG: MurR/RpiR family transcriptional regulator [Janthinobacterium lividum]